MPLIFAMELEESDKYEKSKNNSEYLTHLLLLSPK